MAGAACSTAPRAQNQPKKALSWAGTWEACQRVTGPPEPGFDPLPFVRLRGRLGVVQAVPHQDRLVAAVRGPTHHTWARTSGGHTLEPHSGHRLGSGPIAGAPPRAARVRAAPRPALPAPRLTPVV